ncbi:nicotinate phosphoribosyltransferase [Candidatus Saccharibacteria bacterium RIFCSPHIGHO2_12_FULL_42_8]|nr:MAG: nicotinate phosphoribosyltransferase [Candidatus Saccharibacteria bacterium RIFCSPHIGHO2_12_FULL_42_8]
MAFDTGYKKRKLSAGLDFYKPTMSQVEFHNNPDEQVEFTFKNRGKEKLTQYVDVEVLQTRLDAYKTGFDDEEIEYLGTLLGQEDKPLFDSEYLEYLRNRELPSVNVVIDPETKDIAITAEGDWPMVTFWETVVMSEVNELYFETKIAEEGLDIMDIYDEGDRRLSDKIELLKSRPDIKFADFGTRRRFSYRWHNHVVERLVNECPGNLLGVSCVELANDHGVDPIGTFAHEMPMVYAALADSKGKNPLDGHNEMLRDWHDHYGENLSTALTDTFGSEFFFTDMTAEQAKQWKSLRHDSGDPIDFGNRVIEFYQDKAIDPLDKTIVFSDGLDVDTIVQLADCFKGRINVVFGWGTTLTNDLGQKPLNIVMKATKVNDTDTVKLSDAEGKHTGPQEKVEQYQYAVAVALGAVANKQVIEGIA